MYSNTFKNVLVITMLGLLTASAFFIRLENFKNTKMRSIDEIVYFRMAQQVLKEGWSAYHTIPYGEEMAASGRPLPDYFFQPVFKHPPVFTSLVVLSMKIFGPSLLSAGYVSLLLSALMIPLIYLLATLVFDRRVGILSALFLWMDPVNIICSQKVWMDTPIALFTLLSALFFVWGVKRDKDWLFILSGLASGLAVNTKYTGIFITFIIALYGLLYHRDLFLNKKFQLSLGVPFISLVPWLYWNWKVYGVDSASQHDELLRIYDKFILYLPVIGMLAILVISFVYLFGFHKKKEFSSVKKPQDGGNQNGMNILGFIVPVVFFGFLIPKQFLHSLQFTYIPTHTWAQGLFANEPPVFYFGRLLEYSFIYALSFFSVFMYHAHEKDEVPFIRLSGMLILIFFIFWGNFQSRYILSSLPFFIILGVEFGVRLYEKASVSQNLAIYFSGRIILKLVLLYVVLKGHYINVMMSFPNDMCYF